MEDDDAETAKEARHGAALVAEQRRRIGFGLARGLDILRIGLHNPAVSSVMN